MRVDHRFSSRRPLRTAAGRYEGVMGKAKGEQSRAARKIPKVRRAENWLFGGTTALAFGIALSLTEWSDLGAQLTLGGFMAAVFGLHLLGRTGPSEQL